MVLHALARASPASEITPMSDAIQIAGCDPQAACDVLRAMAHPMRLSILCRLLEGELSVSGFESELGLRQPSLSQQLGLLREAGLVHTRREARSVTYSIADRRIAVVLAALRQYLVPTGQTQNAPVAMPVQRTSPRAAMVTIAEAATFPPPAAGSSAECSVFSMAGWNLPTLTGGQKRNG